MNISQTSSRIINKYGCRASVQNNDEKVIVRAFVQPIRYNYREYPDSRRHRLGRRKLGAYLFVSTPDVRLEPNVSVIETDFGKYIVKRCETYFAGSLPVYVWAVLSPHREALEDDYEQS